MGVGRGALHAAGLVKELLASVLSCTRVFLNLKFSKLKLSKVCVSATFFEL